MSIRLCTYVHDLPLIRSREFRLLADLNEERATESVSCSLIHFIERITVRRTRPDACRWQPNPAISLMSNLRAFTLCSPTLADNAALTTVSKALIVAEGYHQGQVTPTAPRTITNGPTFFITCIQPDRTPTIVSRTSASWGRHEQSLAPPTRSQSAVVPHVLRSGGWAVYVPGHGMNQGTS